MFGIADKEKMSRMMCDGPMAERLILVGNMRFRLSSPLLLMNILGFDWIRDRNNKKYREMMGGSLRSTSLQVRRDMALTPFKEENV
jgi:hypothetical protein